MKSSSSSRTTTTTIAFLLLLLHLFVTPRIQFLEAFSSPTQLGHDFRHRHWPPPLCRQLQRKHNYSSFQLSSSPPMPPSPYDHPSFREIDPRYGVEKRLVPTGPNPLHN